MKIFRILAHPAHGTKAQFRNFVVAGLYLLPALILSRLPLFNALGYEFSAAIALLIPWVSGFWTIKLVEQHYQPGDPATFLAATLDALKRNLLMLLLPFIVGTANIFLVKNCSYGEGVLFYLLIPVVTMVYTCALAAFCVIAARRPRFLYTAITLATLLYPVYLGFATPQIFSYNVIFGYFPGFSYDEVIGISATLIVFRLITLVAALWFIVVALFFLRHAHGPVSLRERLRSLPLLAAIDELSFGVVVGFVFLLMAWVFRAPLGFESPVGYIQRVLSLVRTTEHFRIHYAPGEFSEQEIAWVAAEHEFRFAQDEDALQVSVDWTIDSYIYPDAAANRRLIGAGTTNIAKPWRHEIHMNKDAWDAVLKHELVHVLAGEFGMPLVKAHYNIGLVEGLAMAIDDGFGNRTLHENAAAILRFGLFTGPGNLISPAGFMTQSSQLSYVLMGSFCKYLIDRYGMIKFKRLYGGRSPRLAYGKPYGDLLREWQQYLERIDVPEEWRSHIEYYFNRPSIFARECARAIAAINERGWKMLDDRQPKRAMELFRRSLEQSWNSEAFGGLVRSAYRADRYDTVIQLMRTQRRDSTLSSNLVLYYGDALWYRGDTVAARIIYGGIAGLDLSDRYDELFASRLAAMNDTLLRARISPYFISLLSDSATHALLNALARADENPLLQYLDAKLYARRREYSSAIRELNRMHGTLGNPFLDAGREQLLGECYFRLKNFERAKEHFWLSLNYITNQESILSVNDWIDRCEWYKKNFK